MQCVAGIVVLIGCLYGVHAQTLCLSTCRDRNRYCPLMRRMCERNLATRYMCPLTCGVCVSCSTPGARDFDILNAQSPCQLGTCQDRLSSFVCAGYRRNRYACAFFGHNCRLTCGRCSNCRLPPPQAPCTDECEDSHSSCEFWKNGGYCDASKGFPQTRTVCQLSCGECTRCTTTTVASVTMAANFTTAAGLPPTSPVG